MRQYQVPQFIDVEDKIFFGKITLRQFVFLAAGGAVMLISFYLLHFAIFIFVGVLVLPVSLALAFGKINEMPITKIAASALNYLSKPRLYLWKQLPPKKTVAAAAGAQETVLGQIPKLTESKLQDLAWSLDIKEKISREE